MSEFQIGQKASVKAVMSDEAVREFARISGDNNPLHLSDAYAEGTRFGKRIAHGILVSGQISRVIGTILPGEGTVYLSQSLHFKRPVYVGDTVTAEVEIAAMDNADEIKNNGFKRSRGVCFKRRGDRYTARTWRKLI